MNSPEWFDANWFAAQKILQMQALDLEIPSGATQLARLEAAIDYYNQQHLNDVGFNPVTVFSNFEACNTSDYVADISRTAINVSPNALFDIPVYLTNLAAIWNQNGYTGAEHGRGQWTAASALDHLFTDLRISAWEHYSQQGMDLGVNPSNAFDTAAYLRSRASAMHGTIEEAVEAIRAENLNPLQDYFIWGKEHGITCQAPAVKTEASLQMQELWGGKVETPPQAPPAQPGSSSGGGSASGGSSAAPANPSTPVTPANPGTPSQPGQPDVPTPPENIDSFDNVAQKIPVNGQQDTYSGAAGVNTLFDAEYAANDQANLRPTDVITGGANAANTLSVTMSESWPGFSGTANGPNVTGIGRITLENATSGSGTDLNFDAANISDAVIRYDLSNSGPGSLSLKNLQDSVEVINLSGPAADPAGTPGATRLDFAPGAKPGDADGLILGLEKVGVNASAEIAISSIENLALESRGEAANCIDLAQTEGLASLAVGGNADLNIAQVNGKDIVLYALSEAGGEISIGINAYRDEAQVQGNGKTALTFLDYAQVENPLWVGVKSIALPAGGEIDASGTEGISEIRIMEGTDAAIMNINAETLDVIADYADAAKARAVGRASVYGDIGGMNWNSCAKRQGGANLVADFTCNASEDFTINMLGDDTLAINSKFELNSLTGKLCVNDPNPYGPNGDSYSAADEGVMLQAPKATGLTINHAGTMKICGSLACVENAEITLKNVSHSDYVNFLKLADLPSARKVVVNAGGEALNLGTLGNESNGNGVELKIEDAHDIEIKGILANQGDIGAKIDSIGYVQIGSISSKGAVNLRASAASIESDITEYGVENYFSGRSLDIDFSNVKGNVGAYYGWIDLEATAGNLKYLGAEGEDYVRVAALGPNSHSSLRLGSGYDDVVIQTAESIGTGKSASLDVDMGQDTSYLRVYNMVQEGDLTINVSATNIGEQIFIVDAARSATITTAKAANAALAAIGAGFQIEESTQVENGIFEHNGSAYWIAATQTDSGPCDITLLAAEGASALQFTFGDDL